MIPIETMVNALLHCKEYNLTDPVLVNTFVHTMVDNNRVIYEQEGFAFYVKCSDDVLDKIATNPGYILDTQNLIEVFKSNGDNVHFFGVISTKTNGSAYKGILQGIKDTIIKENPKTISWWNPTMDRFHRRDLCQQQF